MRLKSGDGQAKAEAGGRKPPEACDLAEPQLADVSTIPRSLVTWQTATSGFLWRKEGKLSIFRESKDML